MKSFQSIAILATLSGLQLLSGSQAQAPYWNAVSNAVSSSAGAAPSSQPATSAPASATTTGGVVTPSPASFINTAGLRVNSPFDGMQISQNAFLTISASLQSGQAIGSALITVAQSDGSHNTTIVSLPSTNTMALAETWNVNSTLYPVGTYLMNMIVTPNLTTPQPVEPGPSIYYWQAHIKVQVPPSPVAQPNGASSFLSGSSFSNTMMATVAASALVLGSALLL
ncbi:hypothetical protein EMPS_07738 [Entomortierella parvispora]|uniref:Uncharacterized protein n=1 Tax=Entomortierella parvispora TaxID=205924 RepID=A0A9P3HF34_9FUNG|nr:hypothetical protein EMPS_07738 [Entomortierella parvispora]